MHVERTFTVPRAAEAVFDYLADFTHTEQWDPGTVATVRTGGDGGLGTTYRNTSRFLGRDVEVDYRTTVYERPARLVFSGTHAKATSADDLSLSRVSDSSGVPSTRVRYRADFHFSRWIELVGPVFVQPRLRRLADQTIAELREALMRLPTEQGS